MKAIIAFVSALVFGIGLIVSGMVNPAKVLGFLDLARPWDPSLALVIGGALAVGSVGLGLAARRPLTLLGDPMRLPGKSGLDAPLIAGSLVFGIGWGLAGICPGPALVLLGTGNSKSVLFVLAMGSGFVLYETLRRLRRPSEAA